VEAGVLADGDAKARGQRREWEEQRKGRPLGSRRVGADHRGDSRGERSEAGGGGVRGRARSQRPETPRPPSGPLRNRSVAHLPHLLKVLRKPAPRGEY
jgi:hypothetical protein